MIQISISDALYHRLQTIAQTQHVPVEIIIQEALEDIGTSTVSLTAQEEQQLFAHLDAIAQQNGRLPTADWGQLVSEQRD